MPANIPAALPRPGGPPGGAGGSHKYPQYGVNQKYDIVTARNEQEKQRFIDAGYLEWFSSKKAAQNWISSFLGGQKSPLSNLSLNPLAGLFQANIWERVAMVGIGIILIAVGVAQLTHAVPIATKIAKVVK